MTHKMPELPYAKDALEPHISRETIEYHYGKHLQAYVDNLNKLIPGTEYEDVSLEEIIRRAEGPIFNNGAQVWNHTFYFNTFSPKPQEKPEGKLLDALEKKYGSFDNFKAEFEKKATGLFGSGWTWLVKDASGALDIVNESNAGNPIRNGRTPLMVMDMGTCLLYRLSQSPGRFGQSHLACHRLEKGRRAVLGLRHNINIKEGNAVCALPLFACVVSLWREERVVCCRGHRASLRSGNGDDEKAGEILLPFLSFAVRPGL